MTLPTPPPPPNGTSEWMQSLPIWAKLIFQILFIYGPLSGIAIFLVYIGAKNLPDIRMELAAQKKEAEATNQTLIDIKRQNEELLNTTKFILFEYCTSAATTDNERRACMERYRTQRGP